MTPRLKTVYKESVVPGLMEKFRAFDKSKLIGLVLVLFVVLIIANFRDLSDPFIRHDVIQRCALFCN